MPKGEAYNDNWKRDFFQREQIGEYFKENCLTYGLDSMVIVSDIDEIPSPEVLKNYVPNDSIGVFDIKLYWYYLNVEYLYEGGTWSCSYICKLKTFENKSSNDIRVKGMFNHHIPNAGWHFSYLGGVKAIKKKIGAFAHQEINNDKTVKQIESRVKNLQVFFDKDGYVNGELNKVTIDNTFPQYIIDNQEKLKKMGLILN